MLLSADWATATSVVVQAPAVASSRATRADLAKAVFPIERVMIILFPCCSRACLMGHAPKSCR
jgi:hypothetical protein